MSWKRRIKVIAAGIFLALPWIGAVCAQNVNLYWQEFPGRGYQGWSPVSPTAPLVVTGNSDTPTYGAAIVAQAYTVAGDIYCIIGSGTKQIRIKGIRISATSNSGIVGDVSIVLRSSLDTGGGLAVLPLIAFDQNNVASTATVNSFTSAPTPGTSIGIIRAQKIAAGTTGNTAVTSDALFQFSVYWDQPIILRAATQAACVNVSAFGTGTTFNVDHEHTERPIDYGQ